MIVTKEMLVEAVQEYFDKRSLIANALRIVAVDASPLGFKLTFAEADHKQTCFLYDEAPQPTHDAHHARNMRRGTIDDDRGLPNKPDRY